MAFKSVNIVGDGTAQTVVSNSTAEEAVINSLVAYNTTGTDSSITIQIDDNTIITETVSANSRFVLDSKVNMPVDTTTKLTAENGVNVLVNFYQQAIDIAASNTVLQQYVEDVESALVDFDARYLGGKDDEPSAGNNGEALVSGMLYFKNSDGVMYVYDGANSVWKEALPADVVSAPDDKLPALDGSDLTGLLKDTALDDSTSSDSNLWSASKIETNTNEVAEDTAISMSIALS